MKPELNLTNEEKEKIIKWKQSLPEGERKYAYHFVENDIVENDKILYDYVISTDDNHHLIVSRNIELN